MICISSLVSFGLGIVNPFPYVLITIMIVIRTQDVFMGGDGRELADEVKGYVALIAVGAVLEDVEALPGSERHAAVRDGDGDAGLGERGANVGGHIVGPFGGV